MKIAYVPNYLVFGFLALTLSQNVFAKFKVAPCRANGYKSETCLVKEFKMSDEFYGEDFSEIRDLEKKYPDLPWGAVLDSNNSLVSDLSQGANSIPKSQRGKYLELLAGLKNNPNNSDLLEATEIFLKANPSQKFYFSNKDSKMVQKFAETLRGETKPSEKPVAVADSKNRCTPNQKKYMEIMEDKFRCGGPDIDKGNASLSLYTVLAEIAACEKYEVTQIGVVQTRTYRSLSVEKPCVVSLKGSSANIGAGHIDIKSNNEVKSIDWTSGYDLFDKRNDVNFWRSQLLPQVEKIFDTPQGRGRQNNRDESSGGIK